ncbi:helix-turn-helix domain-containing protein [Deinococcus sp. QL22]|uniref:helix-turn-helix domain-containing protein n=1 Tax=Deinococcus sp. QL22 TaxID=2939437 RepID=UPI0020170943|nr:helix-turn-helix domain-containing protein [Deinococcus sp. QL22]UQN07931.1 helix-turn-helix domain-containing protein [Deinococcus sp. QL22]
MKKHLVRLAEAERTELRAFTRSGTRSAQAITRARLLLMADQQGESRNDADIAKALGITVPTVEVTRKRYVQHGLQAVLQRAPRQDKGIPQKVDGRVEAQLISLACSQTPNGESSWTLQMLSDELVRLQLVDSISRETVRKTLKKIRSGRT